VCHLPSTEGTTRKGCCVPSGAGSLYCVGDQPSPADKLPDIRFQAIPAGRYRVGYEGPLANPGDREGPARAIDLSVFRISETAVTNAQFGEFVTATGYRTDAERLGWSFVFHLLATEQAMTAAEHRVANAPWWLAVTGACWDAPEGPGSDIKDREDHPVVHVSYRDAVAYTRWSGTRLPTELEWEVAARGGLSGAIYPWGDELAPNDQWLCNIWQGRFPEHNSLDDGYLGTAPVRSFPPNGYGLYEMAGNVWEWVAGAWSGSDHDCVRKGGSYLCHESWCNRYRVAARDRGAPQDASGNQGFRVATDA